MNSRSLILPLFLPGGTRSRPTPTNRGHKSTILTVAANLNDAGVRMDTPPYSTVAPPPPSLHQDGHHIPSLPTIVSSPTPSQAHLAILALSRSSRGLAAMGFANSSTSTRRSIRRHFFAGLVPSPNASDPTFSSYAAQDYKQRYLLVQAATERNIMSQRTLDALLLGVNKVEAACGGPSFRAMAPPPSMMNYRASMMKLQENANMMNMRRSHQQHHQSSNRNSAQGVVKESNDHVLETLGSSCLERRKNKAPYFDASAFSDPDPITVASRRTRGGVTEPFPEKLYRMVTEAKKDGHEDVISFYGHGRAFGIHKPEQFATEIMPHYFKQSRVSSFQRQLNLYGFTRINTGPDAGGYYHELFLRGRPALGMHIRRVGVPRAVPRRRGVKAHDTTIDPDFYAMPTIMVGIQQNKNNDNNATNDKEKE